MPYDQNATELRVVDYYYDGVRRIQEVFTDPVTKSHPVWLDKENPPDENTLPEVMAYVDRDYIWAPPPSGYVDECLAQVELDGNIDHVIQDASYDVVALVDAGKPTGSPGYPSGAVARVLIQYTYDAYGQPISAEDLTSSPPGRTPGGPLSPSAANTAFSDFFLARRGESSTPNPAACPSITPSITSTYLILPHSKQIA